MQRSALIGPTGARLLLPQQRAPVALALRGYSTTKPRRPSSVAAVAFPHRRFTPRDSGSRPLDLFAFSPSPNTRDARLTSTTDPSQLLLFAHGIHRPHPSPGGVGVYLSPDSADNFAAGIVAPDADADAGADTAAHTPISAHLHAAISALRLRDWRAEGFRSVVVATSAPALVDAIAGRIAVWERNAWRTPHGAPIANEDLWVDLCAAVRELEGRGTKVRFWSVRKEDNLAVGLAGLAVGPEEEPDDWSEQPPIELHRGPGKRTMACIVVGVTTFMIYLAATKKW